MGCVSKKNKEIKSLLDDKLENLSSKEKQIMYKSEIKLNIINLLKECYPSEKTDKVIFYEDAIKSNIGYYDSELLLFNIFLEIDSVYIIKCLLKSGVISELNEKYLSTFFSKYLDFIENIFQEKSDYTKKEEFEFIRNYLELIVKDIQPNDWTQNEKKNENNIIKNYISWLDSNLDEIQALDGYILITKLWNSQEDFVDNQKKSIILINQLKCLLKEKLNHGNSEEYVKFVESIKVKVDELFNKTISCPIIRDSVPIQYNKAYNLQLDSYEKLYNDAVMLSQYKVSNNYFELIKDLHEDCTIYFKSLIDKLIDEKISLLHYPTENELKKLLILNSNNNEVLNKIIKKFYLFEYT